MAVSGGAAHSSTMLSAGDLEVGPVSDSKQAEGWWLAKTREVWPACSGLLCESLRLLEPRPRLFAGMVLVSALDGLGGLVLVGSLPHPLGSSPDLVSADHLRSLPDLDPLLLSCLAAAAVRLRNMGRLPTGRFGRWPGCANVGRSYG